jgi:hypothetical protein
MWAFFVHLRACLCGQVSHHCDEVALDHCRIYCAVALNLKKYGDGLTASDLAQAGLNGSSLKSPDYVGFLLYS